MRIFGIQYNVLALILGYQAETLTGWFYGPPILFIAGLLLGSRYNADEVSFDSSLIKVKL